MNNQLKDTYQVFRDYDRHFERHSSDILFLPQIFDKIVSNIQGNILDIGTGDGHKLETILRAVPLQKTKQIVALEPSPLVKEAGIRLQNYPIKFFESAIEDLKGYSKSFQCILMFEVLEHLPDQRVILDKITQLLHPDGVFIFSTPNRQIYNFTERIAGKGLDPTHCSVLTYGQLRRLISDYFNNAKFYGVLPLAMKITRKLGLTSSNKFPNLPILSADVFCFAREPIKTSVGG